MTKIATVQAPLRVRSSPHTKRWRVMVGGRAVDSLLSRKRAVQVAKRINEETAQRMIAPGDRGLEFTDRTNPC